MNTTTATPTTPASTTPATSSAPTISERLRAALELLSAPFPENAIERTKGSETRKGYDTTGFGYQWIVDRLNNALGIDGWRARATYEVSEHSSKQGKAMFEATAHVRIEIGGWHTSEGAAPAWILWTERECIGGHASLVKADAMKGAFTNGFKKTAALFGCGASAYRGTIDDDNIPLPEGFDDRRRPGEPARERPRGDDRARGRGDDRHRDSGNASQGTPADDPRVAGERKKIRARMEELKELLGAERCRELVGRMKLDTIEQRRAALKVLEEAANREAAEGWTIDALWKLAERADVTEDDVRGDVREKYGRRVEELSPKQVAEVCARLEAAADQLERAAAGSLPR